MPATKNTVCNLAAGGQQVDVDITGTPEAAAIEVEWADNAPGTGAKWLADRAAAKADRKAQAKDFVSEIEASQAHAALVDRAIVASAVSENNIQAAKLNAILNAADGAATYAAFRAALAAIVDAPTRTNAQARQAIRDLIDAE